MRITTDRRAGQPRNGSGDQPKQASIDRDDRISQAVGEFLAAIEAGTADRSALLGKYQDVAEELAGCLETFDFVNNVAPQLGPPSMGAGDQTSPSISPLATLGDFRIVREIGRGGMGVVYEAEQLSLGRRVALKVLPFAAMLSETQLKRFHNEARTAATLNHPHIVAIHSVGTQRGVHYYAMHFVEGRNLAEIIEALRAEPDATGEGRGTWDEDSEISQPRSVSETEPVAALSTHRSNNPSEYFRAVVRLVIQAAEALDHAHQHGVVHRDIKPANLLVEATGKLWVADFGLARADTSVNMTMTGDILGTLRYMSPEQASGGGRVLDHRTDIYSLGTTLYELLTLQPAFGEQDRQRLLRGIIEKGPRPPRQISAEIPKDLETIVLKTIAMEPTARYATAQELADDLRRFLEYQPIRARRATRSDRLWRWGRRNPLVASLVAAVSCLLLVLAVAGPLVAVRQTSLAHREGTARLAADDARKVAKTQLYISDVNSAFHAWDDGSVRRARKLLARHVPRWDEEDVRGFEWHYLWGCCQRAARSTFASQRDFTSITFSPDGQVLAAGTYNDPEHPHGAVKLWDVASREELHTFLHRNTTVHSVAFSPDGDLLASAGNDHAVRLWKVADRTPLRTLKHAPRGEEAYSVLAFSPDGKILAVGCGDRTRGEIRLWDVANGSVEGTLQGHGSVVGAVAFSPDGQLLASASWDGTVKLWNPATREELETFTEHQLRVYALSFSPDGQTLASGGQDGRVKLWDVATRESQAQIEESLSIVRSLVFSPSGSTLAAGCEDGTVSLFNVYHERARTALSASLQNKAEAQIPTDRIISTLNRMETLRGHRTNVLGLAFSPDGRLLASADDDGMIKVWSLGDIKKRHTEWDTDNWVSAIAVSTYDSTTLAVGSGDWESAEIPGEIRLWDVTSGTSRLLSGDSLPPVLSVDLSPDGRLLATGGGWAGTESGTVHLWDAGTGQLLHTLRGHTSQVWSVAFSRDGKTLVSGEWRDRIKIWDVPTGQLRSTLALETFAAKSIAFSPDGSTMAVGGGDWDEGEVKLWNTTAGRELATLGGQPTVVCTVAFSPDGTLLATGDFDGAVRLWDVATGKEFGGPAGHPLSVFSVTFSPDGKTLASGSLDRTVKLWHVPTGDELSVIEAGVPITSLVFFPDGQTLAGGGGGNVMLWHVDKDLVVLRRVKEK
ncbi:MAG: protein kinase [Pirellulaceae bacterium]